MLDPQPIDDDLLAALASGRAAALAAVYDRYSGLVYRVALRFTGSEADAEDILHNVFVALPESVGRLQAAASFEPWLRRMAVRTAMMRLRSGTRRSRVEAEAASMASASGDGSRSLERLELEEAVRKLPEPLRFVFVLREIEGLPYEEIGELLGISRHASQQRMHRARAQLRLLLRS
ncbi:MAG: sigma-70 family RNA polymerase sigma factor [Gemmatimonadota bacterium]|nr:sigma-70 family RNA polymerase sigma factor [Gemmatimonadota bacterium]